MEKEALYRVGLDLIYMSSCALCGKAPDRKRLSQMDLAALYKMAKQHSMQAIVYISLVKATETYSDLEVDSDLLSKWRGDYHSIVRRLVQLDMERESLYSFLDECGAWYVGLKGIVLSNYYPTLGMRQMTDNDILIDPAFAPRVRDYFTSRGYRIESYGSHCHDIYIKGPLTFEIHRMLAEDSGKTRSAHQYYENVREILLPEGEGSSLCFSDDDFYVYYIFHAYKHFVYAGCGLRTLMDVYVYTSAMGDGLNREYIEKKLRKMGTDGYERGLFGLAATLYGADPDSIYSLDTLSEGERETLLYYISSGTFGTSRHMIENRLDEIAGDGGVTFGVKLRYILSRIFPKYEFYKTSYPRASKFIVTIPFLWLFRLFRSFGRHKRIRREVEQVKSKK